MEDLLSDDFTYRKLNRCPLRSEKENFHRELRGILLPDQDLVKSFSTLTPSLPYMYGLVKTHKDGFPMRPIVSSVGSVTYRLAKYLVKLLSPLLGNISDSHIKNNVDLVQKLNHLDLNLDNFKLISFDVKSLFTKVPVNDLLDFLVDELPKYNFDLDSFKIIELIKLCILNCKFSFNDQFYEQIFGMAMGNPLSPLLANIYMEAFESILLPGILPRDVYWFRYVDDIICLWPVDVSIDDFLIDLNSLVPSIQFTSEIEVEGKLPFLDVLIHRRSIGFFYEIYRKPTNILSYIHCFSYHQKSVKIQTFSSMFLRCLRIVSPEFFDNEIANIFKIGLDLGYTNQFLNLCFDKAKKSFYNVNPREKKSLDNMLVLPFYKNFIYVKNLLKIFNVNLMFTYNNIKSIIIKHSPVNSMGGIYKIPCLDCDQFYIGQTGRELNVRLSEHKRDIRNANDNKCIFLHVRDNNHRINWIESKFIVKSRTWRERNIIESVIICQTFDNNINDRVGLYSLDEAIISFIFKELNVDRLLNH